MYKSSILFWSIFETKEFCLVGYIMLYSPMEINEVQEENIVTIFKVEE
jgi:hypothetical protein